MNNALSENEQFCLDHWSMWGSDGYPVVKRLRNWFGNGMRGCGRFPCAFKTKKEAVEMWERYISTLINRKAGRRI